MEVERKDELYNIILDKYIAEHLDIRAEKISAIVRDLFTQDIRGLLIIGSAYLEELCFECFLQTLIKGNRRKKFVKDLKREMTFSMTSNLLWAQNYLSDDVYELITLIRDARNQVAHNAILEQSHSDKIESKANKIKELMEGRSFAFDTEKFKENHISKAIMLNRYKVIGSSPLNKLNEHKEQFLTAIADLISGLNILSLWMIPEERLAIYLKHQETKFLTVTVFDNNFTEDTLNHFSNKFSKQT